MLCSYSTHIKHMSSYTAYVCCSVLQGVAVCCSVLQWRRIWSYVHYEAHHKLMMLRSYSTHITRLSSYRAYLYVICVPHTCVLHICLALYEDITHICGSVCLWYVCAMYVICDIVIYTHACGFMWMFVSVYETYVWLYIFMCVAVYEDVTHISHTHHTHIIHMSSYTAYIPTYHYPKSIHAYLTWY